MEFQKRPLYKIGFRDLLISCTIGILPEERIARQEISIDLQIETELPERCFKDSSSDAIDRTICYAELAELCIGVAKENRFFLLETLAEEILSCIEKRYKGIESARVKIKKPAAIKQAAFAEVELCLLTLRKI